jgi:hypothetical protein
LYPSCAALASIAAALIFGFATLASAEQPAAKENPAPAPEAPKEAVPPPPPEQPSDPEKLEFYEDAQAGYSFRIPAGYQRLTPDQDRQVFNQLSQYFGKDIGDRAMRQPPVYLAGPADPRFPRALPPSLAVTCAGTPIAVDAARKEEYRKVLEEGYDKQGLRHGDIKVEIVKVAGVEALRAAFELFSPVDNTRSQIVMVMVPGRDRRYDIVANYSATQAEHAEPALAVVLHSFRIAAPPLLAPEVQNQWGRIVAWTVGGFIVGIVLSLLAKALSKAAPKTGKAAK